LKTVQGDIMDKFDKKSITINDVAAVAGVFITTVFRVIDK
jgi:hypothetical protein